MSWFEDFLVKLLYLATEITKSYEGAKILSSSCAWLSFNTLLDIAIATVIFQRQVLEWVQISFTTLTIVHIMCYLFTKSILILECGILHIWIFLQFTKSKVGVNPLGMGLGFSFGIFASVLQLKLCSKAKKWSFCPLVAIGGPFLGNWEENPKSRCCKNLWPKKVLFHETDILLGKIWVAALDLGGRCLPTFTCH